MRIFVGLLALSLGACAQFPEVEAANRSSPPVGQPPALLPYSELATATAATPSRPSDLERLEERAASLQQGSVGRPATASEAAALEELRARAAILRQPVEDFEQLEALRQELAATQ